MSFLSRAAAAAGLYCLGSGALAQTVQPPPGPVDRARPEFEPVGGRIGSFILYPRLHAEIAYNDNVLADPSGGRGDFILTAAPGIKVNSLWLRHRLVLDAQLSQEVHGKLSSEDEMEGRVKADGVLDLSNRSTIRVNAAAEFLAEDRFSVASFSQGQSRTRYSRLSTGASYSHDLDPLSLTADLQFSRLDFSDVSGRSGVSVDQDFRDSLYASGSLRGSYRVSPGISAVARLNVDRLDYDDSTMVDQLDRDSTGYKVEAGVGLELSRLLFGDIRAGFLARDSEDPSLPDISGYSFTVSLTWTPTALTTVRFFADRAIEEGGRRETAGNLRSQATLNVEHELRRWIILEGSARFALLEPIGPIADAKEYEGQLSATYLLSRRLRATASVRHSRRHATSFFSNFSQNRIALALRLTF